ncbi:MAG TPA: sigma-54 dependent transcriptional regulator [Burkholderiales bacterium]|nr:sigma-54 dependent transcriptional regulator [Burkholderiales bacterium]
MFGELNLVGSSAAFLDALELIRKSSACDATVLLQGETGTGKELAARAIHYLGARRKFPFVPVNCGALPDTLVENELFGHARGAFTDARDARQGVIAQAQGGTLFLDEVEALSHKAQVALLRFLEDFEYRPLGGGEVRTADVRIIAAGNADLGAAAKAGEFRQDLLFRLNVLPVDLPPLRARGRDIVCLAEMFLQRFADQYARAPKRLHPEAVKRLLQYAWPGNVRELENLIHREFLMSDGSEIHVRCLTPCAGETAKTAEPPAGTLTRASFQDAKARAIASFERAYIKELLERTGGNISQAARISGKERSRLGKMVKKYGLAQARSAPRTDA